MMSFLMIARLESTSYGSGVWGCSCSSFSLYVYILCLRILLSASCLFLRCWFQWFLIWPSVRPQTIVEIRVHWCWYLGSDCMRNISKLSSILQWPYLTRGFSWLAHLSRHCLPLRFLIVLVNYSHILGPLSWTSSNRSWSDSSSHIMRDCCFFFIIIYLCLKKQSLFGLRLP